MSKKQNNRFDRIRHLVLFSFILFFSSFAMPNIYTCALRTCILLQFTGTRTRSEKLNESVVKTSEINLITYSGTLYVYVENIFGKFSCCILYFGQKYTKTERKTLSGACVQHLPFK